MPTGCPSEYTPKWGGVGFLLFMVHAASKAFDKSLLKCLVKAEAMLVN